jgi:hypothetical protein
MPGRLTTWVGVWLLTSALAIGLASCGGDSPEATAKAGTTTGATPPQAKQRHTPASGCIAQLDPFLKAMDALRTGLVAGLAYEQYVAEVKKIMASYDTVPVEELTLGCVQAAGTPAEQALNRYIAASNAWTDCVEVPTCEAVSIEAPLQTKWREASEYLSKAERGLAESGAG